MKIARKVILLILGFCALNAERQYPGWNRSDLWTSGMSDAWQNPGDTYDELRAHNHSIDGDNLDWHAHHHDVPAHVHCKICNEPQAKRQRIAYGYAYKKYQNTHP